MDIKTYDGFFEFDSKWKTFIDEIKAYTDSMVFEKDDYLDPRVLFSGENIPPVVDTIPKRVLSLEGASQKYTNCYFFSKTIEGFSNIFGAFPPESVGEFLTIHKGVAKLLKEKSALAAMDFYSYALNNAVKHQDQNGVNVWFERIIKQLKERAPFLDFRSDGANNSVFTILMQNDFIDEIKSLHKHGCRFDLLDDNKSFNFDKVVKGNSNFNPHYKIKNPNVLKTLLDCGLSIQHFNKFKINSSYLPTKQVDENFHWILNEKSPTLSLLNTFVNHSSFSKENEKYWHQKTVESNNFKSHLNTKNKSNTIIYLEFLINKYFDDFLTWNTSNKKTMHQFLIDEGLSNYADYAILLKNKKLIINSNNVNSKVRF